MWKANGKTTTLQLFLDGLSPKTEKLSLEGTMDLSRDRNELLYGVISQKRELYITTAVRTSNPTCSK
jgi:ABC-type uncharacterized transport system ATPase subunit